MAVALWTNAIILRRIAYGDADLVVTFFSRDHGRMSGIARSARKSRKRFGGAFEPATLADVKFVERTASDLVRIEEAVVRRPANGITRSLARFAAMTRTLELALKFLQERQASPDKFDVMDEYLARLCDAEPTLSDHLSYQLEWTMRCGFGPSVVQCARCGGGVAGEGRVAFDMDMGGALCGACRNFGGASVSMTKGAWQVLRDMGSGTSAERKYGVEAAEILDRYIAHIVGTPLVSSVNFG